MSRKLVLVTGLVVALGGLSAGIAIAAGGGDGGEEPLTGSVLEKAGAAALAHTGGGTVTESEVGDDGAAYEVEVRLSDGRQVEVQLDQNFAVLGQEADDDGQGDQDGQSDDGPGEG